MADVAGRALPCFTMHGGDDRDVVDRLVRLAARAGHDVNNAVAVLELCAAMLEGGVSGDDFAETVADVRTAGARLKAVAGELLALGRCRP